MILVGSTGFVGSNLINQITFENIYHKTDVSCAFGSKPDILLYAGVTGTKFLANKFPQKDREVISQAKINIEKIGAKKIILISSVDVNQTLASDESYSNNSGHSMFGTYGNNRLELENWVMSNYNDYNIIRLPAIYGQNLKKNFIHDLISPIPPMLSVEKINKLSADISDIFNAYIFEADGMYHYNSNYNNEPLLEEHFLYNNFNALSFTNPNSSFQYYNLSWLWKDIKRIIDNEIRVINLVTEPIVSYELFEKLYQVQYPSEFTENIINYNLRTVYADVLGGTNGYIYTKEKVLEDLINFIKIRRKNKPRLLRG